MTRTLYSLLLILLCPLLPLYLWLRGRRNPDYYYRWNERFAIRRLNSTDLFVHCASMGETLAAAPLIQQLLKRLPDKTVTITSSSPTGLHQVERIFSEEIESGRIQHCYLPFDMAFMMRRFAKQISASTCIIMETELWPNLIHYMAKQGSRIVIANGRLSEKSFLQYQQYPKLFGPLLQQIDTLAIQTNEEAARFANLGVTTEKLHICGSLKFDIRIDDSISSRGTALRQQWNRSKVWVAASVHPGEFQAMIDAHLSLLQRHPDALLIMVPRHPEQFDHAAAVLSSNKLSFVRRTSEIDISSSTQVLLADTMGEMLLWYRTADIAFIGGTLIEHGGHNPLEAAALAVPVITGSHYRDFFEITHLLKSANHLQTVDQIGEFITLLEELITDDTYLENAGKGGLSVVASNQGSLEKQLEIVQQQFI